ncbi:hypothetical protein FE784_34405 [Paenibacillus hemerocallicola]|uniref:Tyrosine specific protein phosphatases domain-containing protein n=1 Tax=Paenibacillus hemerocallicola TaxID=1172614 RepID=A0A5C4SY92_9BACL|nr:hypothetical protein FE784_34405 [Paenibacillus hemerocallicola]
MFFVTDHHRPHDEVVDQFVRYVEALPERTWQHFHCRGGVGRTTTFILMYEMMKNSGSVDYEDFLIRHQLIGGRNMREMDPHESYKYNAAVERLEFIRQFYAYCLFRNNHPRHISWTGRLELHA